MDVEEKQDRSSDEKPGTSQESLKEPGTSHDDARKDKRRDRDGDSQYTESSYSKTELKIKDRKTDLPHLGTKKMRVEKKARKRRPVGRVLKRRKSKGRYKRRSIMTASKARAPSMSTEDSRHSESPRPKCRFCGHRCCMQRIKTRTTRNVKLKKQKNSKVRRGKKLKRKLSECNQIGSRCEMLSPLFIKSTATPQEPTSEQSHHCEITPQMIHHSVQELTMYRESVPSKAILAHIQIYYPVNPNVEEALNELAEKLSIANLIGIVWALPGDLWRLTTALEKLKKLDEHHVTLFWRMHADTMKPLNINCKSRLTRSDAQTGPMQETLKISGEWCTDDMTDQKHV